MDLRILYKDECCPCCGKSLIFNHDFTEANCQDINCKFNKPPEFPKIDWSVCDGRYYMDYFLYGKYGGK